MTEAWLLIDEAAIRSASGKPTGGVALAVPRPQDLENIPDPKALMFDLLRQASGASGRRLRDLPVHKLVHRISELITDFSPLVHLPAYSEFSSALAKFIKSY
jgi:hypothetical protein